MMFNISLGKMQRKMSRKARNTETEAEKRSAVRVRVIRDVAVIFVCLVILIGFAGSRNVITPEPEYAFVGGTTRDVPVYLIGIPLEGERADGGAPDETAEEGSGEEVEEDNGHDAEAVEIGRLVRGSSVKKLLGVKELDGVRYCRVDRTGFEGAADLYMKEENLVLSADKVVQETEVYVRTPATIYGESTGPAIASFAEKGSCLKVTGYDNMLPDGSVHKYKVEYEESDGTAEGYVYGKYLTDSAEKAGEVYNENGIYDKAEKDKYGYNLYGGKAENLDYYPYEKPVIEGNEFCADARAMYLNCAAAASPDSYIELIEKTDCNAVVVDIKDGVLAWPAKTAEEWSPRSYKTAYTSLKDYKNGIDKLRDTGVYMIGRIVVFNDPVYAKDHPEDCIKYGGRSTWPSAYSRDVWEYNVRLAQEAIDEFGFNEIQFDYVRFPENAYEMSGNKKTKFRNVYDEEKGQAIQNFCFYAADQIHEAGAYISIDVFGESVYGYMTAYGQYWPGISNIVDAVSAMPYTDHMGSEEAWKNPYQTTKAWAKKAKKQQDCLENPAAARTWITGYDTPYWAPTENYGEKEMKAQIQALIDAGLEGGFIPWNSTNDLGKYKQYKDIWNK